MRSIPAIGSGLPDLWMNAIAAHPAFLILNRARKKNDVLPAFLQNVKMFAVQVL